MVSFAKARRLRSFSHRVSKKKRTSPIMVMIFSALAVPFVYHVGVLPFIFSLVTLEDELSSSRSKDQTQGQQPKVIAGKLRFDWTNMPVSTEMGKQILAHQTNCSLPLGRPLSLQPYGLGDSLHSWSFNNLCQAMNGQGRYRTWSAGMATASNHLSKMTTHWMFRDESKCGPLENHASQLQCYFPGAELLCPGDAAKVVQQSMNVPTMTKHRPPSKACHGPLNLNTKERVSMFRAASIEFMFRQVSQIVVDEAERQLQLVFPNGSVPPNLITVHIRWGDKYWEMRPIPIQKYVDGVETILQSRNNTNDNNDVNILLATEDRNAVEQFKEAALPKGWNVYVDQYFHDMRPYRTDGDERVNEVNNKNALETKGRAGLVALGSLLVAMEANDYVLTTRSNWSRLMNELRQNVVDPRCNGCTHMVDLHYGEN